MIHKMSLSDYKTIGIEMEGCSKIVRETSSDKIFTLKSINYDKKIYDELSTMRQFKHQNIVKIKDILYDDDKITIISEYICMGNIWERASNDIVTEQTCSRYIMQLCKAIKYLHDMEIIYGNLHPGKVLIDQYDNVRLNIMTPSRKVENFTAPEGKYSKKSDIWSIGLLTYFISYNNLSLEFKEENTKNTKNNFIKSLTKINPEERYDINQTLAHSWLKNTPKDEKHDRIRVKEKIDKKIFIDVFLDILSKERKDWFYTIDGFNINISAISKTYVFFYTVEIHENEILILDKDEDDEDDKDDEDNTESSIDIFNIVFQTLTMI